jgi:hypothetical protein
VFPGVRQSIPVRRAAEGADHGEGGIASISTSGRPRRVEPGTGSFRAGAQAVTLDAGRQVVHFGCIPLMMKPQNNEPSLEFSHGAGERTAGIHQFVPESLVALECLGALGGTAWKR